MCNNKVLEEKFKLELEKLYDTGKDELDYYAKKMQQAVKQDNFIKIIEGYLVSEDKHPPEGFIKLLLKGRLDLSIEHLIITKGYAELFDKKKIAYCRKFLEESSKEGYRKAKETLEDY